MAKPTQAAPPQHALWSWPVQSGPLQTTGSHLQDTMSGAVPDSTTVGHKPSAASLAPESYRMDTADLNNTLRVCLHRVYFSGLQDGFEHVTLLLVSRVLGLPSSTLTCSSYTLTLLASGGHPSSLHTTTATVLSSSTQAH